MTPTPVLPEQITRSYLYYRVYVRDLATIDCSTAHYAWAIFRFLRETSAVYDITHGDDVERLLRAAGLRIGRVVKGDAS